MKKLFYSFVFVLALSIGFSGCATGMQVFNKPTVSVVSEGSKLQTKKVKAIQLLERQQAENKKLAIKASKIKRERFVNDVRALIKKGGLSLGLTKHRSFIKYAHSETGHSFLDVTVKPKEYYSLNRFVIKLEKNGYTDMQKVTALAKQINIQMKKLQQKKKDAKVLKAKNRNKMLKARTVLLKARLKFKMQPHNYYKCKNKFNRYNIKYSGNTLKIRSVVLYDVTDSRKITTFKNDRMRYFQSRYATRSATLDLKTSKLYYQTEVFTCKKR